jgi:hypothetical protein
MLGASRMDDWDRFLPLIAALGLPEMTVGGHFYPVICERKLKKQEYSYRNTGWNILAFCTRSLEYHPR